MDVFEARVDINCCVENFYTLVALAALEKDKGVCFGAERALNVFAKNFAVALHDYIVITAIGEARHGGAEFDMNAVKLIGGRDEIYKKSIIYDPVKALNYLYLLFEDERWPSSYGGKKWADIALTGLKFYDHSSVLFVDAVVSKEHNSGCMFNKPVVFCVADVCFMKYFLDFRQAEDILNTHFYHGVHVSSPTYELLKKAVRIGVLKNINEHFCITSSLLLFPTPVVWGDATLD
jgi:hypothetical protein